MSNTQTSHSSSRKSAASVVKLPTLLERHWKDRKRGASIVGNEAIAEQRRRKRTEHPIALRGVSEGKLITVTPEMFNQLDLAVMDPTGAQPGYQRMRQEAWVNKLIDAIARGGYVPDPVKLAKRTYTTDGKLWVVDGQQRMWAHFELSKPFKALVSEVDSYKSECDWFIIENDRKLLQSNLIASDWTGPCAVTLRAAHRDPGHPLYGKVNYRGGQSVQFNAMVLLRGMAVAATGSLRSAVGGSIRTLQVLDNALTDPKAATRAQMFLRVLPQVFPTERPRLHSMQALGLVAFNRWRDHGVMMPDAMSLSRMRRINWGSLWALPTQHRVRLTIEAIEKAWRI
jgi:hypothetical protein